MQGKISRRNFLKKSAIALGAVAVTAYGTMGSAEQMSGSKTIPATKEREMPHVIVKLWPGRSESDKKQMAEAIVKDVARYTKSAESSISVAIEEVSAEDWKEKVYKPDILNAPEKLYKKPGYSM